VVEDEANMRTLLRSMLEKDGWKVDEAKNGRVALERIAAAAPTIILLDLLMPEMDGFQFVAELRKKKEWRPIPIIVITAKDITSEDRRRLDGYVHKILKKGIYSKEELLLEVRDLVKAAIRKKT
jgi:CheY-like chemotaxis protein